MKKTTIEDFRRARVGKIVTETGTISHSKCNINTSAILTILIQEAGRWCKSYASDLFIWWDSINRRMETDDLETSSFLFGFRERGVDNAVEILSKYQNDPAYVCSYEYRAIWRLDVKVGPVQEGRTSRDIEFQLYEVER